MGALLILILVTHCADEKRGESRTAFRTPNRCVNHSRRIAPHRGCIRATCLSPNAISDFKRRSKSRHRHVVAFRMSALATKLRIPSRAGTSPTSNGMERA